MGHAQVREALQSEVAGWRRGLEAQVEGHRSVGKKVRIGKLGFWTRHG